MLLPQEVKYGEPFQAKLVRGATRRRRRGSRSSATASSSARRSCASPPARTCRITGRRWTRAAFHVYQARPRRGGDTIEDNNRAVGTVVVPRRRRCCSPTATARTPRRWRPRCARQNIEVTVVEPRDPKDVAGLQKYDGVVLSNVSSLKLTRPQMAQIRDYVRDHGGAS